MTDDLGSPLKTLDNLDDVLLELFEAGILEITIDVHTGTRRYEIVRRPQEAE